MLPAFPLRLGARLVVVLAFAPVLGAMLVIGGARSQDAASGLIAFARADGIYVMGAGGSGVHALRRGGVATQPRDLAWSRDGRRLLFVGRDDASPAWRPAAGD